MSDTTNKAMPTAPGSESDSLDAGSDREWPQDYDPNRLLDGLMQKMRLENDAALANKLQVIQPIIRMIREEKLAMSPSTLLMWLHEATGIALSELGELMGER